MRDQLVGLFERTLVEQELDPLAGRHLAFLMLPFATLLPTSLGGKAVALLQFFKFLFQVHCRPRTRAQTSDLKTRALPTSEVRRPTPVYCSMLDPIGW